MKKLIAIIMIAIISLFSFTGCGENTENAASEAGELVTDASESMSSAVSDMMDNTDGDINDTDSNGNVSQN